MKFEKGKKIIQIINTQTNTLTPGLFQTIFGTSLLWYMDLASGGNSGSVKSFPELLA